MRNRDPKPSTPKSPHAPESAASTKPLATYGSPSHPLAFSISIADNGTVGYTGVLKPLCMKFIWTYGGDFRIGWFPEKAGVEVDAQADIRVRLADGDGCEEGWRVVGEGPVFWDRVVLVGPVDDLVGLGRGKGLLVVKEAMEKALRCASEEEDVKFLFSREGSATFGMEQRILHTIDLSRGLGNLRKSTAPSPLKFLADASENGAYALTTRALFLTAHRDGVVPNLRVHAEGGRHGDREGLLPWFVLTRSEGIAEGVEQRLAVRFAEWLGEDTAQGTLRGYGRVWEEGVPLFTGRGRDEIADEEGLVGREW